MKVIKTNNYKVAEKEEKPYCTCPDGPSFGTKEWDEQESNCPKCGKPIYR